MLFGIEVDSGSYVACYLVPDTGGTVPTIQISSDGVELAKMQANDVRQAVVAAGRHATGLCGFVIDEAIVPGLSAFANLEIVDAGSGILVYRRAQPEFLSDTKIFRLETHLLPLWRIDDALKNRFQFWYKGIDRLGRETSEQVFCINNGQSSFISGRLLVKSVEFYLTKGFRSVVIFRDPHDELAERLVVLKNITERTMELLGARDALTFEPVINYLADFEHFDSASVKRLFRKAPEEVLGPLSSPFVRQLTAATPSDRVSKASIAPALQVLSDFEIIGLRSQASEFSHALADMVGVSPESVPVMAEYAKVRELGDRLRGNHDVEDLLEQDLEIFHHTSQAFGALG